MKRGPRSPRSIASIGFACGARRAEQRRDGTWLIETTDGDDSFDFLVVANGIFSRPAIPEFDNQDAFLDAGGRICHSSEFTNLDDARGKNVVVIGYGKSSCDVAAATADTAQSLHVVAREIIWKAPKKFAGVLNYKCLLLTRLGEGLFKYRKTKGFEAFLHGPGKALRNSMIGSALLDRQRGWLPRTYRRCVATTRDASS